MDSQVEKPTILVVDDMPENIDLLVGLLKPHYRIKAARSGEVALKVAQSLNPPDLLLLDINMPGMDGFDVFQALKQQPETATIPVIFVSAEVGEVERKQAEALGAAAYLTKPVEPKKLNAVLKDLLQ